jgi:hypothetical protein
MHTFPPLRFRLVATSVFVAGVSLLGACKFDPLAKRDHTLVVLIDQSASIQDGDRAIYEQSFRSIGGSLKGGDRLIIAPVNATSRSQFVSALDVTIPSTGRKSQDALNIAQYRKKVQELMPVLLPDASHGGAKMTRLVETIAAATEAFGPTPNAGNRLVLLTDGVEDSPIADLDNIGNDPHATTKALDKARALGMLPNLTGVELSIVGAGGDNFVATEGFWKAYASATGATLAQYGRLPFKAGG